MVSADVMPDRRVRSFDELRLLIDQTVRKRLADLEVQIRHFMEKRSDKFSSDESEVFSLLHGEMHSLYEYLQFLDSETELHHLEKVGGSMEDAAELRGRVNMFKAWWSRMNKQITEGHARRADRDVRTGKSDVRRLTVQEQSQFMADTARELAQLTDQRSEETR